MCVGVNVAHTAVFKVYFLVRMNGLVGLKERKIELAKGTLVKFSQDETSSILKLDFDFSVCNIWYLIVVALMTFFSLKLI